MGPALGNLQYLEFFRQETSTNCVHKLQQTHAKLEMSVPYQHEQTYAFLAANKHLARIWDCVSVSLLTDIPISEWLLGGTLT